MEKFDINRVIEYYKLDTDNLSRILFPDVKYPKQAFDRVLKGESTLSVVQLELLASHIGVLVSELFYVDSWKSSCDKNRLVFTKGEYKVILNYNGAFISIYKNGVLKDQKILNVTGMTISEFINYIDELTKI